MFRNTNIGILVRKVVRFYAFNWRSLDYFLFLCKVKTNKKMNKFTKAIAAIMLMMVFAVGCNKKPVEPQKQIPVGAVDGLFSVSENKQVYFSHGNLQYQPSTNTWQFANDQYDFLDRNEYVEINENYSDWIDAFAWGTSGINHGAVCYQPWSNSENDVDYYVYGDSIANLYDHTGQADWGYNPIQNGGNQVDLWRTLTKDEWEYVFDKRDTPSGARFAYAVVNGVMGTVLFPDDWDASVYTFDQVNVKRVFSASITNVISETDWHALHYQYGLVFLPNYYRAGLYWSSSCNNTSDEYGMNCAYSVANAAGTIVVGVSDFRHQKAFVRLVRDAE